MTYDPKVSVLPTTPLRLTAQDVFVAVCVRLGRELRVRKRDQRNRTGRSVSVRRTVQESRKLRQLERPYSDRHLS